MKLKNDISFHTENMELLCLAAQLVVPEFFESIIDYFNKYQISYTQFTIGYHIYNKSIDAILYQKLLSAFNKFKSLNAFS